MSTLGRWWTQAPWPEFALTPDARAAIVQFGLGLDPLRVHSSPEDALSVAQETRLAEIAARHQAGEPLAYILGKTWFYGLPLSVSPAVLIPRPDTECLVEVALRCAEPRAPLTVIDVCTGSGAVALALKSAAPAWTLIGRDVCAEALAVAERNAAALSLAIHWQQGSWLEGASECDLIVANPPYIAAEDPLIEASVAAYEPHLALYADEAGMFGLRRLLEQGRTVLSRGGWIALEHGPTQARGLKDLAEGLGYTRWSVTVDLAGRDRVSLGCWEG